jgi:dTDP-glucose 4,6-dehydratase
MDEIEPSSSNGARERLVTYVSDRPGHDQRYAIDPSKTERARQRPPGAKARRRM